MKISRVQRVNLIAASFRDGGINVVEKDTICFTMTPGRVEQWVTCLDTDANLIADLGVAS